MDVDLLVENHGSIFLLRPTSDRGQRWTEDNLADDVQIFGGAIVVEHRYIQDIVQGALADGLEVGT